jgi:hypothetical protein
LKLISSLENPTNRLFVVAGASATTAAGVHRQLIFNFN